MEKNLAKDILWDLECAEAQLAEDIDFLSCVESEHFATTEPEESITYLYWQLRSLIITLRKSMQYNQFQMKNSINKHYKILRKEGWDINGDG